VAKTAFVREAGEFAVLTSRTNHIRYRRENSQTHMFEAKEANCIGWGSIESMYSQQV
jgi:hypothetical protein